MADPCFRSTLRPGGVDGPRWPKRSARLKLAATLLSCLLAACSSTPPSTPVPRPTRSPATPAPLPPGRDGPEANPPPDLLLVPDAEPRIEPVRNGGPNKPYEVLGQSYAPVLGDPAVVERGLASWYGRKFHGRSTASGEIYNMYAMTAAHKTMPIPSYARVRNPANGREVLVRINDRGPFHSDRIVDLSYTAALKLGVLGGVSTVELERITYEAIRTGSWRRPAGDTALAAAPQPIEGGAVAGSDGSVADPIAEIAKRVAAEPQQPALVAGKGAARSAAVATPAPTAAGRGFWLQLGAFRQRAAATDLQQQLQRQADWLAPLMAIFNERSLHRLQAGPYASRDDANAAAERLRDLLQGLPMVVERR